MLPENTTWHSLSFFVRARIHLSFACRFIAFLLFFVLLGGHRTLREIWEDVDNNGRLHFNPFHAMSSAPAATGHSTRPHHGRQSGIPIHRKGCDDDTAEADSDQPEVDAEDERATNADELAAGPVDVASLCRDSLIMFRLRVAARDTGL